MEEFDRTRLSKREDEILGFAIEGMTDIQIAQRLDISQSTVNSYWVRIRGKLGQLSRTELVALALKQKAKRELDAALARSHEYEQQAREHARLTDDFRQAESYHAALDALPEAMLYVCQAGVIRYTNERLDAMFGYERGELVGEHVQMLMAPRFRERERQAIQEFIQEPHPIVLGIDRVVYGRRSDGYEFRVVLMVDARPSSTGLITSCIVRDFLREIDTRRRVIATAMTAATSVN